MIFPGNASDKLWDAIKGLGNLPAKLAIAVILGFSEPLNTVRQWPFAPGYYIA